MIFGGAAITEGIAKDFGQEIALELGFFQLLQLAAGFEVGPAHKNGVSALGVVGKAIVFGILFEKARQNQAISLRLARGKRVDVFEQGVGH